jgi:hypothetical protein
MCAPTCKAEKQFTLQAASEITHDYVKTELSGTSSFSPGAASFATQPIAMSASLASWHSESAKAVTTICTPVELGMKWHLMAL